MLLLGLKGLLSLPLTWRNTSSRWPLCWAPTSRLPAILCPSLTGLPAAHLTHQPPSSPHTPLVLLRSCHSTWNLFSPLSCCSAPPAPCLPETFPESQSCSDFPASPLSPDTSPCCASPSLYHVTCLCRRCPPRGRTSGCSFTFPALHPTLRIRSLFQQHI